MGYKKALRNLNCFSAIKGNRHPLKKASWGTLFPFNPFDRHSFGRSAGRLIEELSKTFNAETQRDFSVSQKSGVMVNRVYSGLTDVISEWDGNFATLGDVLQPNKEVDVSFKIDKESLERWKYLKGAKREPRTNKALGYTYMFSEGVSLSAQIRLIVPLAPSSQEKEAPARLARSMRSSKAERFVVSRPLELERLNMFPIYHTRLEGVFDGRRAFFMGNALVVGIIERVGTALLNPFPREFLKNKLPPNDARKSVLLSMTMQSSFIITPDLF